VIAATRSGAQALGLGSRIGSIEPGKRADLIAIDARTPHSEPFTDLASTLVYSAKAADVTDVWVDGRRLLDARRFVTLDERAIIDAAIRWRARVEASLKTAPAAP
jgi:5-methylthioadenosine/S-adenosylhomocysteine deaminase